MANIAYIRVSTETQNEERQYEGLRRYNIEKIFEEKVSAKNVNRPKLKEMLEYCRDGDTVYVHDFSRLARSTTDLLKIVEQLQLKGVRLVSCKESFDTSTATGKLMLTMIGAIYEFERANLLERIREGIEIAKKAGKYKGRKRIALESIKDFSIHYSRYMNREVSKAKLARELKISRPTLDKIIKEYNVKKDDEY